MRTKKLTLSFDISKGFWPERQSFANLPILISCPAYEVSPQFEVFDCHKDETTGLTLVGQAELTAIVLYPKAYGRDEEADRLFKGPNNDNLHSD